MRTIKCTFAVGLSLLVGSVTVMAEDIAIEKGYSAALRIPGNVEQVAVGDPKIADIQPLTANTFVINAIKLGSTNILAFDVGGNVIYSNRIFVKPTDPSPGFPVNIIHGTRLARGFICDPNVGCPKIPAKDTSLPPPPVIQLQLGPVQQTTVNTEVGVQQQPAAPTSE